MIVQSTVGGTMAAVGVSAPASFLTVQKTSGHLPPSTSETVPMEGMMLGGLCYERTKQRPKIIQEYS